MLRNQKNVRLNEIERGTHRVLSMNSYFESRRALADRIQDVRLDRYGDGVIGLMFMASAMDLPQATWKNYEAGVTLPAEVLLRFIELTRVRTRWLLSGEGRRYESTDGRMQYSSRN